MTITLSSSTLDILRKHDVTLSSQTPITSLGHADMRTGTEMAWSGARGAIGACADLAELVNVTEASVSSDDIDTLLGPTTVTSSHRNGVTLCHDGETRKVDALVIADGSQSQLSQALGFRWTVMSPVRYAATGWVTSEKPHGGRAMQWANGPSMWALLPTAKPTVSYLIRSTDSQREASDSWDLQSRNHRLLEAVVSSEVGSVLDIDKPVHHRLTTGHAAHAGRGRVCVIGDALHTLHPFVGMGANCAAADCTALAQEIMRHRGRDLSDAVQRYASRRAADAKILGYGLRGLMSMMRWNDPLGTSVRRIGQRLTACDPMKKRLAEFAGSWAS